MKNISNEMIIEFDCRIYAKLQNKLYKTFPQADFFYLRPSIDTKLTTEMVDKIYWEIRDNITESFPRKHKGLFNSIF